MWLSVPGPRPGSGRGKNTMLSPQRTHTLMRMMDWASISCTSLDGEYQLRSSSIGFVISTSTTKISWKKYVKVQDEEAVTHISCTLCQVKVVICLVARCQLHLSGVQGPWENQPGQAHKGESLNRNKRIESPFFYFWLRQELKKC